MDRPSAFIRKLPKAELHLHIEGTLEPEMMLSLAKRNGIRLPWSTPEQVRAAYAFNNLDEFLTIYYQGTQVLREVKDFYELANAYFAKAATQNIRHVEIFFDPQAHTSRKVPFSDLVEGLHNAQLKALKGWGISSRLIMCFLRHLDAEDAMKTLDLAIRHRHQITAVGLDSSEVGNPPSKFTAVFARARAAGFRTVAHAGEEGPASYVRQALDLLQVERIDHGNRSMDDPQLIHQLARRQVPLTLCPLSNLRLGVIDNLAEHPLGSMLAAGLLVTINSDDPAFFGGYLNENYQAIAEALSLSTAVVADLARNSFRASFLEAHEKAHHIREIETLDQT